MKAKFELKMKMKQLDRSVDNVKFREQNFRYKTSLKDKAKGTSLYKQAFELSENARNAWYKAIDEKMALEQEIEVLKVKVISEVLEEIK